jgi:hypothetical protein
MAAPINESRRMLAKRSPSCGVLLPVLRQLALTRRKWFRVTWWSLPIKAGISRQHLPQLLPPYCLPAAAGFFVWFELCRGVFPCWKLFRPQLGTLKAKAPKGE